MIDDMRCIYTIFQNHSFSKAAKKLFMTQPALSATVKRVEIRIGYPIFDRSTNPITVTKEGEYYLKSVKKILDIENNIFEFFEDLNTKDNGSLTLGGSSYFCSYVFPDLLLLFHKKYSNVKIDIIESDLAGLVNGLEAETIDLVFETAILPNDYRFKLYPYDNENIILAVPAIWEINKRLQQYQLSVKDIVSGSYLNEKVPAVPLLEFKDSPFIRMRDGNDQWKRGLLICQNAGFEPHSIFTLDQILTAFIIANNTNCGAVFIRDSIISKLREGSKNMIFYKIDDPLTLRPISIVKKRNRYVTRSIQYFLDMIALLKKEKSASH